MGRSIAAGSAAEVPQLVLLLLLLNLPRPLRTHGLPAAVVHFALRKLCMHHEEVPLASIDNTAVDDSTRLRFLLRTLP